MNIYQKLAKIRKPVEVLQKNKQGFGYRYVTEDLILSKITGLMDKLGVSLIPRIVKDSMKVEPYAYTKTKSTKDGKIYEEKVNEVLVSSDMEWVWINNDEPTDFIVVPWAMVGQQADASQAFGSGLTYSSRYFMLKYFNVATSDDDPDNWRRLQKEAESSEDKEIAAKIIEQIHSLVTAHLETKPEDKPKVIELVKRYAKTKAGKASANYYDIEDPVTASQLLEDLTVAFASIETETKPTEVSISKTTKKTTSKE